MKVAVHTAMSVHHLRSSAGMSTPPPIPQAAPAGFGIFPTPIPILGPENRRQGRPQASGSRLCHAERPPDMCGCAHPGPWTSRAVLAAGSGSRGSARTIAGSTRLSTMAFGQQSGPPASASQVRELLALLKEAGHADFREARGPLGFTQRQAAGKFTRGEAAGFIDRLQSAQFDEESAVVLPASTLSGTEQLIRRMPDEQLAAELQRRGWTVTKP